jgi:hypothetical protein
MALQRESLLTEVTAPLIRLEEYVRRPEWASLPMQIKVSVVHLWRAEHDPPIKGEMEAGGAADGG